MNICKCYDWKQTRSFHLLNPPERGKRSFTHNSCIWYNTYTNWSSFPCMCSNIIESPLYGVYVSQLIRYAAKGTSPTAVNCSNRVTETELNLNRFWLWQCFMAVIRNRLAVFRYVFHNSIEIFLNNYCSLFYSRLSITKFLERSSAENTCLLSTSFRRIWLIGQFDF